MKIYLASSWRNERQPAVLAALRSAGHEVYDFRNPAPGDSGFGWREIDEHWIDWTPDEFIRALEHPIADHGFSLDMNALRWCEACVLLLPCGRSAHLELGWACGAGKKTVVIIEEYTCPGCGHNTTFTVRRMVWSSHESWWRRQVRLACG